MGLTGHTLFNKIFINFLLIKYIVEIFLKRIYFNITIHLNSIGIRDNVRKIAHILREGT